MRSRAGGRLAVIGNPAQISFLKVEQDLVRKPVPGIFRRMLWRLRRSRKIVSNGSGFVLYVFAFAHDLAFHGGQLFGMFRGQFAINRCLGGVFGAWLRAIRRRSRDDLMVAAPLGADKRIFCPRDPA
jgi:hypothetical protein